jgi:formylglycine-generating enzyme required for sulfatase activity
MKKTILIAIVAAVLAGLAPLADASFLTIGNPGNPADPRIMSDGTSGYGHVQYTYQIMSYAVTNAQWNAFIQSIGSAQTSTYTGDNKPVQNVSWYQAAQYCNWLTTGNPYKGVYQFDDNGLFEGADREQALLDYPDKLVYALPTEDEWHKAAYYDPVTDSYTLYANGSDLPPVPGADAMYAQTRPYTGPWNVNDGAEEQNGTYNMMGNIWEWTETALGSYRVLRGGAFDSPDPYVLSSAYRHYIAVPHGQFDNVGFRVVIIPEPAGLTLLLSGGLLLLRRRIQNQPTQFANSTPMPR